MDATFSDSVDFAQLQKIYDRLPEPGRQVYAPARLVEAISKVRTGNPDKRYISTSYIERQNLTLRVMSGRFTRLTNAFSQKTDAFKGRNYASLRLLQLLPNSSELEADSQHGCWHH